MLEPTGRTRNEDRRLPKEAKHFRPEAFLPPPVFVSHPPARRRSATSGSAARRADRPSVYTPYAPASLGTPLASAFRKGPEDSSPVPRRSAATSLRPRPARLPSSN